MAENQRISKRALLALTGILAIGALAILIAIRILIIRANMPRNDPLVSVPVTVGGQRVIIYPNPAMSVRIVSGQSSSVSPDDAAPTQSGVGGQGPESVANQTPAATTLPPAATALPPATPTPRPPAVILIDYLVAPGDTLYRLTQVHNTSIELMASHNIAAASLVAGTSVRLPVANPDYCPGGRPHVVLQYQTVSDIARLYGTTAQVIGAANGLDANYSVNVTQVICVP